MELYPLSAAERHSAIDHAETFRLNHAGDLLRRVTDGLLRVAWMQTYDSDYAAGRLMNEAVAIEAGTAVPTTRDEIVQACLHLAVVAWFEAGEHQIPETFSVMDNPFLYLAERCFWEVAQAPEPPTVRSLVKGDGDPETAPFVLYRHWGTNDDLLYVGQTSRFWHRQTTHAGRATWWSELVAITWEPFETIETVRRAEMLAIDHEKPRHNRRRG